jgi:hypothetical protein
MKFDWKDAAMLLCTFVLINALAAYIQWDINPMSWGIDTRFLVVFVYIAFGSIPVVIRRVH